MLKPLAFSVAIFAALTAGMALADPAAKPTARMRIEYPQRTEILYKRERCQPTPYPAANRGCPRLFPGGFERDVAHSLPHPLRVAF